MRLAGTPRRFATWIAALAVLMAALAPAWSHALSAGEAAEWVSVCSAQGTKWVPGDADGSGVPAATHAFEHCPYCSVHAQLLDLPPAVAAVAPAAGQREAVTQAAPTAPRTLHAWPGAQPRAPPPRA